MTTCQIFIYAYGIGVAMAAGIVSNHRARSPNLLLINSTLIIAVKF